MVNRSFLAHSPKSVQLTYFAIWICTTFIWTFFYTVSIFITNESFLKLWNKLESIANSFPPLREGLKMGWNFLNFIGLVIRIFQITTYLVAKSQIRKLTCDFPNNHMSCHQYRVWCWLGKLKKVCKFHNFFKIILNPSLCQSEEQQKCRPRKKRL